MKKFLLLTLSQLFALYVLADGFPRYYELVTSADQLESGKYYVIVAIPEAGSFSFRKAYNGFNTSDHKGNSGIVTPNELHGQAGITPSQFSGIIDIGKDGNAAKPLKMTINAAKTEKLQYTVWNFVDESVGTDNQLVGVNAETTGESQHYLIGSEASSTNEADHFHLWTISLGIDDLELRAFIRNVGKTYYLKYDANSYGDEAGLFRVYASTTAEKRNLMLYKEMETVEATTSFTGHGTLYYSDKVLMVPDGVTARTYTLNDDKKAVTSHSEYLTEHFIPANSAVVLYGATTTYPLTSTYTFPVTNRHNPDRDDKNILLGLDNGGETTTGKGATEDAKYYFYKLTTKNNVAETIGFYWAVNEGKAFTSAAHKAYLAVEKDVAANIRSFLLDFSETTSISNVSLPTPEGTKWVYDLSGRRFSTSQSLPKGIYISNGKKFVVK